MRLARCSCTDLFRFSKFACETTRRIPPSYVDREAVAGLLRLRDLHPSKLGVQS